MKTKQLTAILCSIMAGSALASDFNIGYINVDRIMSEATPAKVITSAIKAKFESQQAQLAQLNQKIMSEESELMVIQGKASSYDNLPKNEKTKYSSLSEKFNKDKAKFMQQYSMYNQQINATEQYALQAFLKQAYDVLKTLGTEKNLDLVLTSNQLVYAKAKYDLTDQFIKQIDTMNVEPIVKQIKQGPKPINQQLPSTM